MNSPFSSFPEPLFQSEVNCDDIDMKISFYCHENKTHFHKKCLGLSLILKGRVVGVLKWRVRVLKSQMNLNYIYFRFSLLDIHFFSLFFPFEIARVTFLRRLQVEGEVTEKTSPILASPLLVEVMQNPSTI